MFEATKELQENYGIFAILLGRIDTPEHARKAVDDNASRYLFFACIGAGLMLGGSDYTGLLTCVVLAGLGYWLLRTRSRVIACVMLVWFALGVLSWGAFLVGLIPADLLQSSKYFFAVNNNIYFEITLLALAVQTTLATFRFHGKWENGQNQENGNPVAVQ
jgi:hypothetical protein